MNRVINKTINKKDRNQELETERKRHSPSDEAMNNSSSDDDRESPESKKVSDKKQQHGEQQHGALPEIRRDFLVTHTSDNWKIRKAARIKEREERETNTELPVQKKSTTKKQEMSTQETKAHAREFQEKVEKTRRDRSVLQPLPRHLAERRFSADDIILTRHKRSISGILEKLSDRDKRLLSKIPDTQISINALLSPRDVPLLSSKRSRLSQGSLPFGTGLRIQNAFGNIASGRQLDVIAEHIDPGLDPTHHYMLERDEKPLDEGFVEVEVEDTLDNYIEDNNEVSSGIHESTSNKKKKLKLLSDDFDTDLSSSDSESDESNFNSPSKNKTLKTYQSACAKYKINANQSFVRQCGGNTVDIRNRMLTCNEAKPIAIALVADKKSYQLDISDNPLGPLGTSFIAELMYANKTINELNLSKTQPGRDGLLALSQTLNYNKSLRRLHLDNNNLQQKDGDVIARLITSVPDLRELDLQHNALGFQGMRQIALALASNRGRLSVLNLQYNNIRTISAVQMALALGKNTTLRTLNLSWNGIGIDGCRALAVSLAVNTTLKELDLTCNRLGIPAVEYLVKGLLENSTLSCIKLARNPLTTEGAKAIVNAIESHESSGLTEIDLRDISIDQDFITISDQLREDRSIFVHHDTTVHMATTDQAKSHQGNELDRFDPTMVLYEYMKKDNLRVIDLFQFFDVQKRDKLSKGDFRDGINILMIPFTEDAIDRIMKDLDKNRDGFITLDELVKGYRQSDKVVKQRRIRASQRKRPDKGLEDLWAVLKDVIDKRKAENERRSVEVVGNEGVETSSGSASGPGAATSEGRGTSQRRRSSAAVATNAPIMKKKKKKKSKQ